MDHRTIINGIMWIVRTGSPWRDLPAEFGEWQTVYTRFRRWTNEDLLTRKQDTSKSSLKSMRKAAGWNTDFFEKLLFGA
ncbi:hypothetical protein CA13_53370 [Planctomycetes bacterium CA13]|uniref:Insertion element IS402-like domain-containing protein n=2 Tax=Novipirellula herctigrandis TaxID=2527986 RepID=A0A5C5Z964_9BACT|nr:hypothetical protein CA13_53370 [Planctomycetes bacterium CA13]